AEHDNAARTRAEPVNSKTAQVDCTRSGVDADGVAVCWGGDARLDAARVHDADRLRNVQGAVAGCIEDGDLTTGGRGVVGPLKAPARRRQGTGVRIGAVAGDE